MRRHLSELRNFEPGQPKNVEGYTTGKRETKDGGENNYLGGGNLNRHEWQIIPA
jgi:hypothetical protein